VASWGSDANRAALPIAFFHVNPYTLHTYAELVADGGRHARTDWSAPCYAGDLAELVAATLRLEPDALISRAADGRAVAVGLMPGGLG
jgi:hypothetical protein